MLVRIPNREDAQLICALLAGENFRTFTLSGFKESHFA